MDVEVQDFAQVLVDVWANAVAPSVAVEVAVAQVWLAQLPSWQDHMDLDLLALMEVLDADAVVVVSAVAET